MELRVLEYYLTIVREGNITKAANALHITQPTLSRQIQQLEEELNVVLFSRGKQSIELTDAGRLLKHRAEELLTLANKTKLDVSADKVLFNGEIAIGCAECKGMQVLADSIDTFHLSYPEATYDLHNGNADQIEERLENGLLDLALVLEPIDLEKYEYIRIDGAERWGIVLSVEHALAQKEQITQEDLVGEKLIRSKRRNMQSAIVNWMGKLAPKIDYIGASNLIGNASILVQKGIGHAFVIEGAVTNYQHPAVTFRPLAPELATTAVLVWKKHQKFNPTVAKFIEHLQNTL